MSYLILYYLVGVIMLLAYSGVIGDLFSTNMAISLGAREGNPVEGWVMKLLHDKWVIARCLFGLISLAGILSKPEYRASWVAVGVFTFQVVITWYAVINNIIVIRKQRNLNRPTNS